MADTEDRGSRRVWPTPGAGKATPRRPGGGPGPSPPPAAMDDDAVIAAADLVGRAGARSFEIGWDCPHGDTVGEDHDCPGVRWYASASYRDREVKLGGHPGPVEAAEALDAQGLRIGAGLAKEIDELSRTAAMEARDDTTAAPLEPALLRWAQRRFESMAVHAQARAEEDARQRALYAGFNPSRAPK